MSLLQDGGDIDAKYEIFKARRKKYWDIADHCEVNLRSFPETGSLAGCYAREGGMRKDCKTTNTLKKLTFINGLFQVVDEKLSSASKYCGRGGRGISHLQLTFACYTTCLSCLVGNKLFFWSCHIFQ